MPEEIDVDTKDLQDTIEELHEERKEREESERRSAWTRYIALTTAILAVFAAIGALRAGTLVNEAVLKQLEASDKWNEYQADRTKDHLYTLRAQELLDSGVHPPAAAERAEGEKPKAPEGETAAEGHAAPERGAKPAGAHGRANAEAKPAKRSDSGLRPLSPPARLKQYLGKIEDETNKEERLQDGARDLEKESRHDWAIHETFAISVALIQVAIALGAVAALTRMKPVWFLSLVVGFVGIYFFATGLLH